MAPPSVPDKYPPEYELPVCTSSPSPCTDHSPRREAFASPFVTIEVGSDDTKRIFQIRKDVLSFYSGYFAAALNGSFVEAEENVCRLSEEDPIIFEMFQHWMHEGTLYASTLEPALLLSYVVSDETRVNFRTTLMTG